MANEPVFLDTSGLVALLNKDDWLHNRAVSEFVRLGRSKAVMLTSNLVLAELANTLCHAPTKTRTAQFVRALLQNPDVRVVFVDAELFARGLARFEKYRDKEWGLVDCVSFELMSLDGSREAFTGDHHFEQAGYLAMLGGSV